MPLELPKTKPPTKHETIIKREREAIGLIKKKFPTNHANTTTNKRTKCFGLSQQDRMTSRSWSCSPSRHSTSPGGLHRQSTIVDNDWSGKPGNECRVIMNRGAPGLVMGPCIVEIDGIFIRDVQYQFEVNRCGNEEVNFQGSSANSVGGECGQDGRTDGGDNHIIDFQNLNADHKRSDRNSKYVGGDSGQDGRTDRRQR
ncbi:hypothetical protein DPMN_018878 [Dreissena polymorpha]|uniref:Uncharacterized protein n=1 Tax=Dreissena polymorpha TaxID=45954 RepID=A0A9D4S7P5_DREPO|nr:hypothetical protein DPMN_018878 [Dreissena polymorpha]